MRPSHCPQRSLSAFAALALLGALLPLGAACAGGPARDYGPWRLVETAGLAFRAPAAFGSQEEGPFLVFRPSGESDRLPFIAVAAAPTELEDGAPESLLAALRPGAHDPALTLRPTDAPVQGGAARGYESSENGVRGWTYLLTRPGQRPVAALAIGTPAHWAAPYAERFRDAVLKSVKLP